MSLHRLLQYNNETCYAETFKIRTHENKLFVDSLHQWHIKIRTEELIRIINTFSKLVFTLPQYGILFVNVGFSTKEKGLNISHCIQAKTMQACTVRAMALAKNLNINLLHIYFSKYKAFLAGSQSHRNCQPFCRQGNYNSLCSATRPPASSCVM